MLALPHSDVLRSQLGERPQRLPGAVPGSRFQEPPGQHEQRYGDDGFQIDVRAAVAGLGGRQQAEGHPHAGLARATEEERIGRPAEGRRHAQRHQRVHGRRRMPQPSHRPHVERPRTPHRNRRGQYETQPLPVTELPGGHHRQHEYGQREQRGDDQPVPALERGCPRRAFGLGFGFGPGRSGQLGRVPGALDCRDELGLGDVRRMVHPGTPGGQVDRGTHAVQFRQPLLHPTYAGRAGHAADDQIRGRQGGRRLRGRHPCIPLMPPMPPLSLCGTVPPPPEPVRVPCMPGATGP